MATPEERTPAPPPSWQGEVVGASGLNVLAGIWLVISPWVVGYENADAWWNPIILGAITAVIALVRISGAYRESWLSWINALIGVWLFASAFWLADSAAASWNVGISGAVVFILAVISADASQSARAHPRGREPTTH